MNRSERRAGRRGIPTSYVKATKHVAMVVYTWVRGRGAGAERARFRLPPREYWFAAPLEGARDVISCNDAARELVDRILGVEEGATAQMLAIAIDLLGPAGARFIEIERRPLEEFGRVVAFERGWRH